uniref:Uncharacterized protein n=1 Tax=Stomoxys calcitrans TaxID=35570 RepID=A0A1I8Q4P3_STOCA
MASDDLDLNEDSHETDSNKDSVKKIVWKGLAIGKRLEDVEELVEKHYGEELSDVDKEYIKDIYIDRLTELWLQETKDIFSTIKSDGAMCESFVSQRNAYSLKDLPEVFRDYDYYKLLMKHISLIRNEEILFIKFKIEFLEYISNVADSDLRNLKFLIAFEDHLDFIPHLDLVNFHNGEIGLTTLIENISKLNDSHVLPLKEAAKNLQTENQEKGAGNTFITELKKMVAVFMKPLEIVEKILDNRLCLEIRAGNLTMLSILPQVEEKLKANSNIEEVRFVATVLLVINADLKNEFWHGKNIVMLTQTLRISGHVKLDVSGLSNRHAYGSNAGTSADGNGLQGNDGYAGESAGNVFIFADKIQNIEQLAITADGGNGSSGQDGGDGKDGIDGQGICKTRFSDKFKDDCKAERSYAYNFFIQGETEEGMQITYSRYDIIILANSYLLYLGSKAKAGGDGGANGFGGQGGFPGEISVSTKDTANGHTLKFEKSARQGKCGENGKGGLYGKIGKDGCDIGFTNHIFGNLKYFGLDENTKIEVKHHKECVQNSVWCGKNGKYVTFTTKTNKYNTITTLEQRRKTRENTERKEMALATRKKAISQSSIMSIYSQYIEKSMKTKMQDLSLEAEKYQELANKIKTELELRLQADKQTTELAVQHHLESASLARRKPFRKFDFEDTLKDSGTENELADKVIAEPLVLDNWLKLEGSRISSSRMKGLSESFLKLKKQKEVDSSIDNTKFAAIAKVWELKNGLSSLEKCANALSPHPQVPPGGSSNLTPEQAARYLVEDKDEGKEIVHEVLGPLHEYFYENTPKQRESVVSFFSVILKMGVNELEDRDKGKVKEEMQKQKDEDTDKIHKAEQQHQSSEKLTDYNYQIVKATFRRFVMEVGDLPQTHSSVRKLYNEWKAFEEKKPSMIDIHFETFYNELTKPVHTAIYELWLASNDDKSLQKNLEEKTRQDSSLYKLFDQCKAQLELDYDWANCFVNEDVCRELNDHILHKGPISVAFRELLAVIFDINIRVYSKDEDNNLYAINNHNANAGKAIHILEKNEKKFVQLAIDEDLWLLEEQRLINSSEYCKELDTFLQLPAYPFDIQELLEYFPVKERIDLQKRLKKITLKSVQQPEILLGILRRFRSDGRHISFQELCLLINAIIAASQIEDKRLGQYPLLWIVSAYPQTSWIDELLLLQMENYFRKPLPRKVQWRELLKKIENVNVLLLLHQKLENHRNANSVTMEIIEEILFMLSNNPKDVNIKCKELKLHEWQYALKDHYWSNKLEKFGRLNNSDLATAAYYLLSAVNTFGTGLVETFIEKLQQNTSDLLTADVLIEILSNFHNQEWALSDAVIGRLDSLDITQWQSEMRQKFSAIGKDRNISQLVDVIKGNDNTSKSISENLATIKEQVKQISGPSYTINGKAVAEFTENDINNWRKEFSGGVEKYEEIFAVINRAIKLKNGWELRDTQKLTTFLLLANKRNILAQVATGEGKSIVVVALAIMKVLCGQKVDVVTSSSVLAKRDAEENIAIYRMFDVSVSHNCSNKIDKRKAAYCSNEVVYGDLSNFQRDYLLHTFYGTNILGDRRFQNIIVDEVDSMLLDKGNNTLYLSHEIASLDKLESLYISIWQWINQPVSDMDEFVALMDTATIKEVILQDLYGLMKREDMELLGPDLSEVEKDLIYERLIEASFIDNRGFLLKQSIDDSYLLNRVLQPEFQQYQSRLSHLFQQLFRRDSHINVPKHLAGFIEHHLDSWIENAKIAFRMKEGIDYVVDVDRTGTSADRNPNITIIDTDTGADLNNSQWDNALHQFLQLKHGCKLSLQSLKAVFVSSVSYFKLYKTLYGLTGTLGSPREKDLLQDLYNVDFVTIPTSKSKQFTEIEPIICANKRDWVVQVKQSAKNLLDERSVLVICESVKDVRTLVQAFGGRDAKNVHSYTRDYEAFDLAKGNAKLEKGHVIIATNLAGRGTDLKITDELEAAGGLHVCLTYLPNNIRIEQQAFGRAARKGDKGTGQLVIVDTKGHAENTHTKIFDLREEAKTDEIHRLASIKDYYETQITVEEECFKAFRNQFETLKANLNDAKVAVDVTNILLHSCLDKWAFWLDKYADNIKKQNESNNKNRLKDSLEIFISDLKKLEFDEASATNSYTWFPWVEENSVASTKLGRQLAQGDDGDRQNAIVLFDKVISEDPEFSETAHYYKAYALSKEPEWLNKPEHVEDFRKELQEAQRLFTKRQDSLILASAIIRNFKNKNGGGIIEIDGYEVQQKSFIDLYRLFLQSVDDIVGVAVSPTWFTNRGVEEELSGNLYEDLITEGVLKQPQIVENIPQEKLQAICFSYGVPVEPLNELLSTHKGQTVDEQSFLKALREKVPMPNSESFWEEMLRLEILKDDRHVVMVDKGKLAKWNKVLYSDLLKKVDGNTLTRLKIDADNKDIIFLKSVPLVEMDFFDHQKFVDEMGERVFEKMKKMTVVHTNRQGRLDPSKADSVKLSNYDSISVNDFAMGGIAGKDVEVILQELEQRRYIEKNEDSKSDTYRLLIEYDEIEDIELKPCPVYEMSVKALLNSSFAYRIALQQILRQVENENFPLNLTLMVSPHASLFSDLLEETIVNKFPLSCSENDVKEALKKVLTQNNVEWRKDVFTKLSKDLFDTKGKLLILETPDPKLADLMEVSGECNFGNVEEVQTLSLNGLDKLLQMEETKWWMKIMLSTTLVTALGVVNTTIGTAIELLATGVLNGVGGQLMKVGIGKMVTAVRSLYNDATNKIRRILDRSVGFVQAWHSVRLRNVVHFGYKLAIIALETMENVKPQLKFAVKLAKQTVTKAVNTICVKVPNIINDIKTLCESDFSSVLVTIVSAVYDIALKYRPIHETLESAYRTLNEEIASNIVVKVIDTFVSFNHMESFFANIIHKAGNESAEKKSYLNLVSTWMEAQMKKLFDKPNLKKSTSSYLDKLNCELAKQVEDAKIHIEKENVNEKALADWKTCQVKKFVEKLTQEMEQLVKLHILRPMLGKARDLAKRTENAIQKRLYQEEGLYWNRFAKLKEQYGKKMQDSQHNDNNQEPILESHITNTYHRELQKLIGKTKDPHLFAEIVRDNVPLKVASVAPCVKVIHKVLVKNGCKGGLTILIENDEGVTQTFSSGLNGAVVRLKVKDNNFQLTDSDESESSSSSSPSKESLYEALKKAVPELNNVSGGDFRQRVADIIEQDVDIQDYIRKRWILERHKDTFSTELPVPIDSICKRIATKKPYISYEPQSGHVTTAEI